MSDGYAMIDKEIGLYLTNITLYEQQKYIYDNKVHSVEIVLLASHSHGFVLLSEEKLKPLLNLEQNLILVLPLKDTDALKKISFEAYNESTCLTEALERFKEHTGHYPERVLADQIY